MVSVDTTVVGPAGGTFEESDNVSGLRFPSLQKEGVRQDLLRSFWSA